MAKLHTEEMDAELGPNNLHGLLINTWKTMTCLGVESESVDPLKFSPKELVGCSQSVPAGYVRHRPSSVASFVVKACYSWPTSTAFCSKLSFPTLVRALTDKD